MDDQKLQALLKQHVSHIEKAVADETPKASQKTRAGLRLRIWLKQNLKTVILMASTITALAVSAISLNVLSLSGFALSGFLVFCLACIGAVGLMLD